MKISKLIQVVFKKIFDEIKLICLLVWLLKKGQLGVKLIKFCCKGEYSQILIKIY